MPLLYFKGFHALQAYRVAHHYWTTERTALALYLQSRISEVLAVDIHPGARIGKGILFDHATSVVIGETAVVEDDFSMLHEVTLVGTGKQAGIATRIPAGRHDRRRRRGARERGHRRGSEDRRRQRGPTRRPSPLHGGGHPRAAQVGYPSHALPALEMDQSIEGGGDPGEAGGLSHRQRTGSPFDPAMALEQSVTGEHVRGHVGRHRGDGPRRPCRGRGAQPSFTPRARTADLPRGDSHATSDRRRDDSGPRAARPRSSRGPRPSGTTRYVHARLREVTEEVGRAYQVRGGTYRNVIAELGPDTAERIVVGAHYDTAGDPGADDNASGVAASWSSRGSSRSPPPLRVELVAYTLEEPPRSGPTAMGSAVHARALARGRARVRLMIRSR